MCNGRICNKCNEWKTNDKFSLHNGKPRSWCKECAMKHDRHMYSTCSGTRARHMLKDCRNRAKKKDIEFSITKEWIKEKIDRGTCEITGIAFDLHKVEKLANPFAPSVDQINPSEGYTPENCRVVIWCYNAMKCTWTDEICLNVAAAIVEANNV